MPEDTRRGDEPQEQQPEDQEGAMEAAEVARRQGPRNPVLRFFAQNRGITALLAVMLLGVLFTPQYGADTPYLLALMRGEAKPLMVDTPEGRQLQPPLFLTSNLHASMLYEYAEYGLLATGMTLVILTAGIDLSVGSVLGITAVWFTWLLMGHGLPPLAAAGGAITLGAICGLANGLLVSKMGLQPFVATLAMMVAARGGAKVISGGQKVAPGLHDWFYVQRGTPDFMKWMTDPAVGGFLRPVTVLFVVAIVVMALIVKYTRFGRYLYAIGGNEEAARLSGVPVNGAKILSYSLCGALAGLAGISNACRLRLGNPEAGFTFELDAIAAVVIGGTSLMGGRGSVIFTLIGTLIIGYINKILSVNAVPEAYRLLVKGMIIVVAVVIQSRRQAK
jgi:ribose/xylose/arabinose/galactoside ABC-type transport system permease subunit